jgi:putative ABC transport system permease protein
MRFRIIDVDRWQEIAHSISKHKLRTVLTGFGVFWGILMLVLLLGMGNGLENGIREQFKGEAQNSVWIFADVTTKPYKGMSPGRRYNLANADWDNIRNNVNGVLAITPRNSLQGEFTVRHGKKFSSFEVLATYPEYKGVKVYKSFEGRFINQTDIQESRKVAYIGREVYRSLFEDTTKAPFGEYINVKGTEFVVIGVFESEGGDRENRRIYIPFTTAQKVYNIGQRVDLLVMNSTAQNKAEFYKQQAAIRQQIGRQHQVDPTDGESIRVFSAIEELENILGLFTAIKIFVWVVSIATLLAGIVGVSNIMMIIVKERTREIGVRKAMGATPWSIINLVLQESIVITSVAGYIGLVVGVLLLEGVSKAVGSGGRGSFFTRPEVDFQLAIVAVLILVVSGALAGFFPAYHAARVQPIEALREEIN